MFDKQQAIGVFDSGVGGLSVLAHIHKLLPAEQLVYVADSANMPYGCKSEQRVQQRCLEIAAFLVATPCKAIVVACNTATAAGVHLIRDTYHCPVIGMEPAIKPAVAHSRNNVIGVLATRNTVNSDKFNRLTARFAEHAKLMIQPCPGLVEQIESGAENAKATRTMLNDFLQPMLEQGMDTLVLGCTHYPYVLPAIRSIIGDAVQIIDAGDAIASELQRQLESRDLLASGTNPTIEFWSSGDITIAQPMVARMWGQDITLNQLPC